MVSIIISTTSVGIILSNNLKRKYIICKELESMCDSMIIDLSYKVTPIKELLEASSVKYDCLNFISIDNLSCKGKVDSCLNNVENQEISDFLYSLGKSNSTTQIRIIEGFKGYIHSCADKYENMFKRNNKLYISFGLFGGIILSLMFI